jgi:hypothetical protein
VFSDGWVEETVSFRLMVPTRTSAMVIECVVPENPGRADWRLIVLPIVDGKSPPTSTVLEPGLTKLVVELFPRDADGLVNMELHFGPGFHVDGPDPREFRARLHSMHLVNECDRSRQMT